MSCYSPSHMAVVDLETPGNALRLKHRFDEIGWKTNIEHHRAFRYLGSSKDVKVSEAIKNCGYTILEVPCGNCLGCRLDYSKDWATRADLEAKRWKFNWFITLTYDEENLPKGTKDNPSLNTDHIDDFIQSIRNYFRKHYKHDGIRYLLAGEYGDLGGRPHYHLILFNCPLPDIKPYTYDADGNYIQHKDSFGQYYLFSDIVENAWKKRGMVTISEASWYTSAYVSQYVVKKQKGQSSQVYDVLGIIPPFLRVSNKPGIGYCYYEENVKHLAEYPLLYIPRNNNKPLSTRAPRYFKKHIVADGLVNYEDYFMEGLDHAEKARSLIGNRINENRNLAAARLKAFQDIKKRVL